MYEMKSWVYAGGGVGEDRDVGRRPREPLRHHGGAAAEAIGHWPTFFFPSQLSFFIPSIILACWPLEDFFIANIYHLG
jgi:hypothetical protein